MRVAGRLRKHNTLPPSALFACSSSCALDATSLTSNVFCYQGDAKICPASKQMNNLEDKHPTGEFESGSFDAGRGWWIVSRVERGPQSNNHKDRKGEIRLLKCRKLFDTLAILPILCCHVRGSSNVEWDISAPTRNQVEPGEAAEEGLQFHQQTRPIGYRYQDSALRTAPL